MDALIAEPLICSPVLRGCVPPERGGTGWSGQEAGLWVCGTQKIGREARKLYTQDQEKN